MAFVLRPETEADIPFLRRLYLSTPLGGTGAARRLDRGAEAVAFWKASSPYSATITGPTIPRPISPFWNRRDVPAGRLYIDRRADR